MPTISKNQLKGNYAENLVAEWVSRVCLVRPVAAGTDIGIDLYCESLVDNNPHLHFWIQVKAINKRDITEKDGVEYASYRFKRSHLEYWAHQPIPVYAFLVPIIGWPPKYPERIFGVPITRHVITHGIPTTETVNIETSDCTEFKSIDKDWEQFVNEIVPADLAILLLGKGLIAKIDFLKTNQTHYPYGFAKKYATNILDGIRDAAVILGSESLEAENNDEEKDESNKPNRQICEEIVSLFPHRMHEMGLNFLTESAIKDKNYPKALRFIELVEFQLRERSEIDDSLKTEYMSKIELLKQKITKLV